MNKDRPVFWRMALMTALLALVMAVTVWCICTRIGTAEALPSPEGPALVTLDGDLRLSDFPMDLRVAECLRVDVAGWSADGASCELTLPNIPPGIRYIALFDGYHLILGKWEQADETALKISFPAREMEKLDGYTGVYLVIITGRGESDAGN